MKKTRYKIYLRPDYSDKSGKKPLYLRLRINGSIKNYSLDMFIHPRYWNKKSGTIRSGADDYIQKNTNLDRCRRLADDIIWEHRFDVKPLTYEVFEKQFFQNNTDNKSFYNFAEAQMELEKGKFTEDTIRTWTTQISKLKKFRPNLSFPDIDLNFLQSYEHYMLTELGNNRNTSNKSLTFVRNIINRAIKNNLVQDYVFKHFSMSHVDGNREFLTRQEVSALMDMYYKGQISANFKIVLRYFLFSCFTGLRYSDICEIKYKHIVMSDEKKPMIALNMHKTKKMVRIPLIKLAKDLISEGFENENLFQVYTNQPTNRALKDITKEVKITKTISFHCARHTFATIARENDIPFDVVSELLGHTSTSPTKIYTKYTDKLKWEEMEKFRI